MGLIERELSELKEFDFHRVADHFASLFDSDDRMIGGHIVADFEEVGLTFEHLLNAEIVFFPVCNGLKEASFVCGYECLKVHKIFG